MPKEKSAKATSETTQHSCPTCQGAVGPQGHLCVPATKRDEKCDWCGALIANPRHLCSEKVKELSYICNSCGRTAVAAEHLCRPEKIK